MYFSKSIVVANLMGLALAQVPKGFTPEAKSKLEVMFKAVTVKTPGEMLPKAGKCLT